MSTFPLHVPPGFRFHPTDEELVDYYLRKKIASRPIDLDVIKEVDLYRIEPWDLQELCRLGTEEQNDWYFFSHKDKKYPTGTRMNRATTAGFWKATGRDKAIYSKHDSLIGMRKTLVFYKGRAPNGMKSDWIMHEYRLENDENGTPQEEGWVVCRVFKKRIPSTQKLSDLDSPIWYDDDQVSFMPDMDSPRQNYSYPNLPHGYSNQYKKAIMNFPYGIPSGDIHNLPLLENPKLLQPQAAAGGGLTSCSSFVGVNLHSGSELPMPGLNQEHIHQTLSPKFRPVIGLQSEDDQVTDWRLLDRFVASQLSQGEIPRENDASIVRAIVDSRMEIGSDLNKQEMARETASTSPSSSQIDLWK